MKKLFSIVFATLLFFSMTVNAYSQNGHKDISIDVLHRVEKSSVSIFSVSSKGSGRCSGTIIKENDNEHHVLTAKHCIDVDEEIYVENVEVKLVVSSPSDDLAYLILDGKIENKEPIELAETKTQLGDTIHHIGYPNFAMYTKSGEIIQITKDWQYANFKVIGGCSGGGIFNEESKLVGVLWGGFIFDAVSIFEPLDDIKTFLETIKYNVNKYKE